MNFTETKLKGAFIIQTAPYTDNRGFFARTFCKKEFLDHGIDFSVAQSNLSLNKHKRTVRGMHFQKHPFEEAKLAACLQGAMQDIIIDLRKNSPTYCQWISVKLTDENKKMIYIPKGFAHGFQTLKDNTLVSYQMSEFYNPESSGGIRWDDPFFKFLWTLPDPIASEKDKQYADFKP